jgi:uncharacterized protein YecT (DUF1311 family)
MDKADAVDPKMIECYSAEGALQDKRLNDAYRKFLAKLDPARRKALVEVQRLWLRYSDANCDFWYDPNGGTAARMASNDCNVRSKAARAAELEELARVQSGSTP